MPKCHKCYIARECRNIGLAKKNDKGEVVAKGCPLLVAFSQSWILAGAHPELFKQVKREDAEIKGSELEQKVEKIREQIKMVVADD